MSASVLLAEGRWVATRDEADTDLWIPKEPRLIVLVVPLGHVGRQMLLHQRNDLFSLRPAKISKTIRLSHPGRDVEAVFIFCIILTVGWWLRICEVVIVVLHKRKCGTAIQ
jgi:hypothetical protein